jgi:hypothetical protein
MAVVFQWNGRDLPDDLRALPEGTYVLEALAPDALLSPEEEEGLLAALESAAHGRTVSGDAVKARIERRLGRPR